MSCVSLRQEIIRRDEFDLILHVFLKSISHQVDNVSVGFRKVSFNWTK